MKIRQSFVSNSSSASFIVGVPELDKKVFYENLYDFFEHIYFGKYYMRETVEKDIAWWEDKYETHKIDYEKKAAIPKNQRMNGNYDPLDWIKSSLDMCSNRLKHLKEDLETLEEIHEDSKIELVDFGLNYYNVYSCSTYLQNDPPETEEKEPLEMSHWDPDATDDRDITFDVKPKIEYDKQIGYQLFSNVTMFNEYSDVPAVLRNIAGVLAFVYKDNLKCWVEEH